MHSVKHSMLGPFMVWLTRRLDLYTEQIQSIFHVHIHVWICYQTWCTRRSLFQWRLECVRLYYRGLSLGRNNCTLDIQHRRWCSVNNHQIFQNCKNHQDHQKTERTVKDHQYIYSCNSWTSQCRRAPRALYLPILNSWSFPFCWSTIWWLTKCACQFQKLP